MIAFGPITSRRLGTSLGINNLASQKKCSYSCVYCQVGNTKNKTILRENHYEPQLLYDDVKQHLKKLDLPHKPDYLSFVANGEPTLDLNLGREIKLLKQFDIPIAVITNSSILDQEHVRKDIMKADWISVKIDTVDESIWKQINKPSMRLKFDKILEGIEQLAHDYKGKLCTETMLIEGYNDDPETLEHTASFISKLKPDTAYLSVPTRPPAQKNIHAVPEEKITEAWKIFKSKNINTETLTGFEGTDTGYTGNIYNDILNITRVHPLREDTLKELLKKGNADFAVVDSLVHQGLLKELKYKGFRYYIKSYHH